MRYTHRTLTWHRRGDAPVDTHILVHHSRRRPEWLDECLASLEDEPTNILLVHDTGRNVGAARAAAMAEGNAPLLCFVDDDDRAETGGFDACIAALEDPALVGAYTDFRSISVETGAELRVTSKPAWSRELQLRSPHEVLHVHVFRRAATLPLLREIAQWETAEEALLTGLLCQSGDWRKLDIVGYSKRATVDGAGSRMTPAMMRTLFYRLRPILDPLPPASPIKAAVRRATAPTGCRACDGARSIVFGRRKF